MCLRESEKSLCVWYLWNLRTCENGEVMSPFTLYGKLKWVGVIPPKSFRQNSSVGFMLHRWMYETACRLEHLMVLYETRSASGKSEARELSPPIRVNWGIVWSCVIEVKTLFFPFYKREKSKFWGAIVGAEIQNSCILGLGLVKARIDKYWILILIHKSEFSRR